MTKQLLTVEILPSLIGKTISWSAPAARENEPYGGICKILSVDMTQRRPITAETIEGDDIWYGFVEEGWTDGNVAYSDADRYISFEGLEHNHELLTLGLASKLKDGDIIEYAYNTELNGGIRFKAKFHQITEINDNEHHRFKNNKVWMKALKLSAIAPSFIEEGNVYTSIHSRDGQQFVEWTNGFNRVYLASVNGISVEKFLSSRG
jgi:hypothetical protein